MRIFRSLLQQPGYIVLTLLTLTLAVGANLVVFTIVNAIWIRPRPVHDPDRVVMVMGDTSSAGSSENMFFAELGLQRQVRDVAAFERVAGQVMTSGENAALAPRIVFDAVGHPVEALGVTWEYFGVLGLSIRGRDFTQDDDRFGAPPMAIISDRLWKSAFHAQPNVIGTIAPAAPVPVQIIGVAPPEFSGARLGEQADLWVPHNLVPLVSSVERTANGLPAISGNEISLLGLARLRQGITAIQAERLIAQHTQSTPFSSSLRVVPLAQIFGSPNHRTLIISEGRVLRLIAAAAGLVLVGGCATLMALVFVHYERRRSEFAVRLALGASAGRLCRRLAAELGWLIAAGSLTAGLVAKWGLAALPTLDTPAAINLARLNLQFDWRVLSAGVLATALTMSFAAVMPMRRFTARGIAAALVSTAATAPVTSLRLRQVMLAAHVTATVAVLTAAGLFVRTVEYGFSQGAGFDVDHTVFISGDLGSPYAFAALERNERPKRENMLEWIKSMEAKLADRYRPIIQHVRDAVIAQPGVQSLALGPPPIDPDSCRFHDQAQIFTTESRSHTLQICFAWGDPEYLHTLGLRQIAGRPLTAADARDPNLQQWAVLITSSLAGALWPSQSPLGRHFHWGSVDYEVVGVLEDFAFGSLRYDPRYVAFTAAKLESQLPGGRFRFAISTNDPDALKEPLRRTIASIAPNATRLSIKTGRELIEADLGRERLGAWFFTGFGLVATCLGIGSTFGIVAYLAESRRREFGIRAALGATPHRLVWMVATTGLLPVAIGTATGLLGATWLGKAAQSFLMGVPWFDPWSYAGAALIILVCAAVAGFVAAWRVKRIAPAEALRSE
jgi:putative ABC transport system permease protein